MKNEYRFIDENTIEMELTQGQKCVIDASDMALVGQYKWCVRHDIVNNKYYVDHNYRIDNKSRHILMVRLMLGVTDPKTYVDHIDGDTLNNRRVNLRLATNAQNQWNRGVTKKSTTGVKNVHWVKRTQKYELKIKINGKHMRYGSFDDINDAIIRRNELLPILQGEFANKSVLTS